MNITDFAAKRYTTKAFDPSKKIPAEQFAQIRELLRLAPSSTNSQPWHFIVASSEEGEQRVAKGTPEAFAYNTPKVLNASHVVVLCAPTSIDPAHQQAILEQEAQDGRFANDEAKTMQHNVRVHYANLHQNVLNDVQHWMEKQVYIALGTVLLGAATLEIDACPIEGFDATILNEELGLRQQGYTASVLLALGHHAESDFNKHLPKSRLPQSDVISEI